MKVHYFQRYHFKEDVSTANAMLLLSRLYTYSPEKFYHLLKMMFIQDPFEPEISFDMQKYNGASRPDAVISQPAFKIVVETKLSDWFYSDQLIRHLESFKNEDYKVLVSLAPEPMDENKLEEVNRKISEYNKKKNSQPIVHVNMTFKALADAVRDTLQEYEYEMCSVVDDYLDCCYTDGLIPVSDSWKYMRAQLAGTTLNFNLAEGVYYRGAGDSLSPHDYIGLYHDKSVRAIGKIAYIVTAVENGGRLDYHFELGEENQAIVEKIKRAINDADRYQYDLHNNEHRYFIVDKFYLTDYNKISPYGLRGAKIFDLTDILGIREKDKMPPTDEIAAILKTKSWG